MRLNWPRSRAAALLFATAIFAVGCSAAPRPRITECSPANLLLAADGTTNLASRIGRSDWPAADGRIEGPEDTVYVEYYRDFQANRVQERSNPQRLFRSYRVGSQFR